MSDLQPETLRDELSRFGVSSSEGVRNTLDNRYWDYLVEGGRVVVFPVFKGTFERGGGTSAADDYFKARWENEIPPAKDVFRTIDYLETRTDIRTDRLGLLGLSWGARASTMVCAVEPRIKAVVLQGGTLGGGDASWDVDLLGLARHCSTPVLMVNGQFDVYGYANGPLPLFNALASPLKAKQAFPSDHTLGSFEKEFMRVNLAWFDRHLGPVR